MILEISSSDDLVHESFIVFPAPFCLLGVLLVSLIPLVLADLQLAAGNEARHRVPILVSVVYGKNFLTHKVLVQCPV